MTERNQPFRKALDQIDPTTLVEAVDTGLTVVDAVGGPEGVVNAVHGAASAGHHVAQQVGANIGDSVDTAADQVAESVEPATAAHQMLAAIKSYETTEDTQSREG